MGKSRKYDDLLNAAQKLFFKYGIKKVTIEDICKEANVSKMTFYKFFPNKIALAKVVLDTVFEANYIKFKELMEADIPFGIKMQLIVQMKMENNQNIGMEFMREIYTNAEANPELGMYASKMIRNGLDKVVYEFVKAQKKGWMRKDIKPALLLAMMDKIVEVVGDERLMNHYDNAQQLTVEITKFFVYGIADER